MAKEVFVTVQPITGEPVYIEVQQDYAPVQAVNGRIGWITLDKSDVGLSNVENISISGVSGYLQYQINNLDTGYASQAEINLLSGLLGQTGSYLYTTITNLSGNIISNYATKIELNNTGSFLYNLINALSGYGNGAFATITNLAVTGSSLNNKINNLSGYTNNTFATISNLATTGQNLQNQINNLDLNYASDLQLSQTGAGLQSQINNLYSSGFITGVNLSPYYLKSNPSGFITGIDLSNYATISNLQLTGQNLQNQINNLDLNYASQTEFNSLSGNLSSTGANLQSQISSLYSSGFLTGVDLSPYYLKSNPSGFITGVDLSNYATKFNLESTGQNLQNQIDNLDNVYATDSSLAQTGQFLDQKIDTFSGTYQNFINNLDANYASQSEFDTLSGNLNLTGQNLDNKINSLSGAAVLTYGDQYIDGQKTFRGEVRIKDLYVTGTETIVNTTNTNVGSNYLLLNATGGAIDAGIFIVTGLSSGASGMPLTGANNIGAVIGYDVPANRWVFGNTSRDSDLSQLEKIAGITDITNYSGFVNSNFYPLSNPSGFITRQNVVFTTGNQTISGLKDFTTRPTVNTIPVALSGEAASNIEQFVKNDYGFTIYKGQPVYVSGSNGDNILIHPASNSGEGTSSKTFGLLKQTLLNNEQGYVVTEGALLNIDTSMAVEGDPVWLGPTGNLIYGLVNKPKAPQHLVSLGFVERAHQNQGKIFVKVQNGFEIDELHDVRIVNKQDSDIIKYNLSSGLWMNVPPSSIGTANNSNNTLVSRDNNGDSSFNKIYAVDAEVSNEVSFLSLKVENGGSLTFVNPSDSLYWRTSLGLGSAAIANSTDFYPYSGNPSGFITGVDLSNYVTGLVVRPEETGNFYTQNNPSGFITNLSISKIIDKFTASSNQPPATGFATLDTRNSILVLDYDDTVNESGTFIGMIPETAGTITGLGIRILWSATTATGGNCRWGARFADLTSSGIDAPFDLGTEVNSAANSISGRTTTTDIVCSGTAGLLANEFYRLLVYRNSADTVNDTMAGDAELIAVEVRSAA